jgi:xanthine/uracil permease
MISTIQNKKQAILYLLIVIIGLGSFIPTYSGQYLPLVLYALSLYGIAIFVIVARLIDYTLNRLFPSHEKGMKINESS